MSSGRTVRQVKHGERLRRSHTSLSHISNPDSLRSNAAAKQEADGHGTDRPPAAPSMSSRALPPQPACTTPPPYRMPPYPMYNEPAVPVPGASMPPPPLPMALPAAPSPTVPQHHLQTHSNKFPIEREVILSSTDKNSKIPILHDYMKKARGAIAPDVPPKQTAAWTQGQGTHIEPNYIGPSPQQIHDISIYRDKYQQDYYNRDCNVQYRPNAVIQRSSWQPEQATPQMIQQEPYRDVEYGQRQNDQQREDSKQKNKNLSKTYHTIKDIISSKFKSSKDTEKHDEDLNNTTDDTSKKPDKNWEEISSTNVMSNMQMQHRYNQEIMQKHFMVQNAMKSQQILERSHHLMQARSQEVLSKYDACNEGSFVSGPSRNHNVELNSSNGEHVRNTDASDDKNKYNDLGSFQARRALSQPHLLNSKCPIPDNLPQPQSSRVKRGSQSNLAEKENGDYDDEWDDGGFLNATNKVKANNSNEDSRVDVELQGASRKKLECEIGNIQGVYNVGLRTKEENEADRKKQQPGSAASSDYDKLEKSSSNADSGRGSAAYSSGRRPTVNENASDYDNKYLGADVHHKTAPSTDTEWVDIVETELRNILKPRNPELSGNIANSTISESISSMTPPLPPLSPGEQSTPNVSPRTSTRHKHSMPFDSKSNYEHSNKSSSIQTDTLTNKWYTSSNQKHRSSRKIGDHMIFKHKQNFGLDTTDITSTTTRSMDLESILDGHSDSDGDLSTNDARTIRKQLEGLEGMYTEVLKLLGVKKNALRYQPSDPRFSKRRYGSISSLPSSSVSSRPIRDKRRSHDDRKKVRDIKGINKRFQRLESHVVTLARSVAHLSSEMRTQHLMIQEMENIRSEISTLRTQTNMLNIRSQTTTRSMTTLKQLPTLANPTRVKKLTKFFGDEPPLLRLFLRNMGYEKFASVFEKEKIGMIELPYLTEERLQKLGIPLGPRLRIMEEAQISVFKENTLCIV